MSKISVRSVPEIRPEDRCYQVSGQESGWALDQFGSPATGEVYIVRHFVHESMIAPWTWWERIFAVNSFSRTLLTGLIENNPQYAFNIYGAAKERFSVTCSPLITEMGEIEPLSEPILRLSQPLVSSIEIEENPIVLINAPVKNRNAIKVVARRQATFKAGPATQIDDSL